MSDTSNQSLEDSVVSNHSHDVLPPSLADQLIESRSKLKCQQQQLKLMRHKIKSYESEPVKKLKLLNLDECAKKLAIQKDNYDTNVNITLELIDSDDCDQEESDAFEVQQEFNQLTISLTRLQSLREAYSHCLQSQATLQGQKRQPDITGESCQMELKRARSALDHIRMAEMNEEVQTQLEDFKTLCSELLMESDRQKRDQASKVDNVKPATLQGRSALKMKMPTFDGKHPALEGFLDHVYSTARK